MCIKTVFILIEKATERKEKFVEVEIIIYHLIISQYLSFRLKQKVKLTKCLKKTKQ